jgi:hypothetical protein
MGCYASFLRELIYSDLLSAEDHSFENFKKYKAELTPLIMRTPLKSGFAKLSTQRTRSENPNESITEFLNENQNPKILQ